MKFWIKWKIRDLFVKLECVYDFRIVYKINEVYVFNNNEDYLRVWNKSLDLRWGDYRSDFINIWFSLNGILWIFNL